VPNIITTLLVTAHLDNWFLIPPPPSFPLPVVEPWPRLTVHASSTTPQSPFINCFIHYLCVLTWRKVSPCHAQRDVMKTRSTEVWAEVWRCSLSHMLQSEWWNKSVRGRRTRKTVTYFWRLKCIYCIYIYIFCFAVLCTEVISYSTVYMSLFFLSFHLCHSLVYFSVNLSSLLVHLFFLPEVVGCFRCVVHFSTSLLFSFIQLFLFLFLAPVFVYLGQFFLNGIARNELAVGECV
jgi:hypothetical protein